MFVKIVELFKIIEQLESTQIFMKASIVLGGSLFIIVSIM